MSEFCLVGRSLVAAVALVAGYAPLTVAHHGLDVDARILDVRERQGAQDLVLLRVADVEVAVGRRYAQVILIGDLRCAVRVTEENGNFLG